MSDMPTEAEQRAVIYAALKELRPNDVYHAFTTLGPEQLNLTKEFQCIDRGEVIDGIYHLQITRRL